VFLPGRDEKRERFETKWKEYVKERENGECFKPIAAYDYAVLPNG